MLDQNTTWYLHLNTLTGHNFTEKYTHVKIMKTLWQLNPLLITKSKIKFNEIKLWITERLATSIKNRDILMIATTVNLSNVQIKEEHRKCKHK